MTTKVAQYITVIDRSNKVIGNSKQFKDVFREAKAAYVERKAEIKAQKKAKEEIELQKAIRAVSIQDEEERASTIRPDRLRRDGSNYGRRSPPTEYQRPRAQRTDSAASMSMRDGDYNIPREGTRQMTLGDFNDAIYGPNGVATQARRVSRTAPPSPPSERYDDPAARGLVRARTDLPLMQRRPTHQLVQSRSADDIDLDLAYGEYHPESLVIMPEEQKQKELSSLVMRCKGLLEEADCAGHSAKAIISHLQKNPDTLAAVGLTLAEISSIATKMAPGALGIFAKSAPGVLALLAAPEFLIAVGVAAGVTIIAIGGYKIIKRIKEKANGDDKDAGARAAGPEHDEALDVRELDRIDKWRRGLPESSRGFSVDEEGTVVSSATSVEGEFISPFAAQSMGHLPLRKAKTAVSKTTTRRAKDEDKESRRGGGGEKKHKKRRGAEDDASVTSKGSTVRRSNTGDKAVVKVKKSNALSRFLGS